MNTNATESVTALQARTDAVQAFILHHLADSHTLTLPYARVPLPWFVSLHGLMVMLAAVFLIVLFRFGYRRDAKVPTGLTNFLELFVVFIRDTMVMPYLCKEDGRRMTPIFCSLFFFILAMNLIGLVPALSTATANLSVTAALAVISLGFMVIGAMYRNGPAGFIKGFIPPGVPWPVLALLVPIEIFGLFVKAFALTIRLFANELAGHIVVMFMLGLIVIFGAAALPFFFMAVLIYILEVGVAFLQAYIFTLLSAVFIGQRYHPEH